MLDLLKKIFISEKPAEDTVDVPAIIDEIKKAESHKSIPLGRRIHSFPHKNFMIALDRDITKNYRVTVYQGRERIYSFSIFANQGNYDILEKGYTRIINYLDGERKVSDLPEDENIKGFFYGH